MITLAALGIAAILYGDGKHDDTCALYLWSRGEPVEWANGGRVPYPVLDATGKVFNVPSGIMLSAEHNKEPAWTLRGGHYEMNLADVGKAAVAITDDVGKCRPPIS